MTTSPAHLGDFLDQTPGQLAEAQAAASCQLPAAVTRRTVAEAHHLILTLGRYADGIWQLPDLGQPLQQAAELLSRAWVAPSYFDPDQHVNHSLPDRLAATALAWGVGADLLASHLRPGFAGPKGGRSDWASVLYEPAVQQVAQAKVARTALSLAHVLHRVAAAPLLHQPAARQRLEQAAHHLDAPAVRAAAEHVDVAAERILAGIPVHAVGPMTPPPQRAQPVAELLTDATRDAHALCVMAQLPQGVLPVAAHWRLGAELIGVTGHLLTQATQLLADRAHELYGSGRVGRRRVHELRALTDDMVELKRAWGALHQPWRSVTTGTAREADRIAPPRLVLQRNLTIRLGRLVHRTPLWTPERREVSPYRSPSDLAPTTAEMPGVLLILAQCTEALAAVAARDRRDLLQQHGHLFALTRTGAKVTHDVLATHPVFPQLDSGYLAAEGQALAIMDRALSLLAHLDADMNSEVAAQMRALYSRRHPASEHSLSEQEHPSARQPVWALERLQPPLTGARLLTPGAALAREDFPAPPTPPPAPALHAEKENGRSKAPGSTAERALPGSHTAPSRRRVF